MNFILGISAFYYDSAAVLLEGGDIVAAVQEERFSRDKYDARFPARAIEYCLQKAGITAEKLDYVVFTVAPPALNTTERITWSERALVPRENYFIDSVHLTERGQEMLGKYLAAELTSLLPNNSSAHNAPPSGHLR